MSRRNTHGGKIAFGDHPFVVAGTECRSPALRAVRPSVRREIIVQTSTDLAHAIPYNSHRRQIGARTSRASPSSKPINLRWFRKRERWTRVARSNREFACGA